MAQIEGRFYVNARIRFFEFDPRTGERLGTIESDTGGVWAAIGLAGDITGDYYSGRYPAGSSIEYDRESLVSLHHYSGGEMVEYFYHLGGPMAADRGVLWVFRNASKELIGLDLQTLAVIDRRVVHGLDARDWFHDLGADGHGGLWGVRRGLSAEFPRIMKKIDIATATVTVSYSPVSYDQCGAGGATLLDGVLWVAGPCGTYELVP
jgi:hypothetical protein